MIELLQPPNITLTLTLCLKLNDGIQVLYLLIS